MAKARMYGKKTTYIPNTRVDLRFIKKMARKRMEAVSQKTGKKSG
jgi:hypothetical protein